MRMTRLVGRTIKETPRDAELPSHQFLIRAGYVRQYSAGIYGLLPLAQRSMAKIERIIREEMNAVEGQEVKLPCMTTKELWDESGRHSAIGKDMFRLHDRNDKPMVLCMTHEEPIVFAARTELTSYRQLPAMLYQIQTKFRDEPRPRGGLIRLREFMMKDAYSFHSSEEDLKKYYFRVHEAYHRVFHRAGCKNVVSVLSDNGMFGGKFSHEFMLLVPTGEDTLITCPKCDYKANREVAATRLPVQRTELLPLTKVHTPAHKTIEEVSSFLKVTASQTCKAVLYQTKDERLVMVLVRGDRDVVEQKIKGLVQSDITPAGGDVITRAKVAPGYAGPVGADLSRTVVVIDNTVMECTNLVTGANEDDYHLVNFNIERDFLAGLESWQKERVHIGDVVSIAAGDPCPQCHAGLEESRGIEVGNIFHLGTRYSASMGCTYLDQNSVSQNHVMGCYGIGVTRLLAAIMEESHDKYGPILPIAVSPFDLHFNVINRKDDAVGGLGEELYKKLCAAGIDVLYDDRDEKAGSQFADADLIGNPLRMVLSPKTLANGVVEFKYRDNRAPVCMVKIEEIVDFVKKAIADEYARFDRQ